MAGLLSWVGRSVDDLVNMGYPESVAKRISSGELPMDYASRMERAMQQGFDPQTYYHAGSPDIRELDTAISSDKKTADTGTWLTEDPLVANSYLPEGGLIYPMRVKTGDMPKMDIEGQTWGNIANPNGGTVTTDQLARAARKSGESGLVFDNVVDIGSNLKMPREAVDDYLGWLLDYQEKGARNVAVNDPSSVRSVNAAFDPEYTGSNILGSRMMPTAATGLLGMNELQAQQELEGLIGQYNQLMDRKPDIYNYGDIAPVKRNVVTGDYSPAVPLMIDEIMKGLLDVGQSRKTGVVNNPTSLWDVLL